MENNLKYSILIPVYNAEKYIQRSLKSAINQTTDSNYEILICDDGSTDNTLSIIQNYQNNKIKIIKNEINSGGIITRKKLLLQAKGKYIIWLDADDELNVECLHLIDNKLNEYDYDIIDFNANFIYLNNEIKTLKKDNKRLITQNLLKLFFSLNLNCYLWGKCLKRQMCIQYLPDDYKFPFDDIFFIMPVFYYAKSYVTIDKSLYNYYVNIGYWSSMYCNNITITKNDFLIQLKARKKCFEHNYRFLLSINLNNLYYNELFKFVDFQDLFIKLLKIDNVADRYECLMKLNELMTINFQIKL